MEKIYKFIFTMDETDSLANVRMETYIFEGTDYTINHSYNPYETYEDKNILLLRNPQTNELIRACAYPEEIDEHIQSFYGGEYIFYSRNDDMNNFLQLLSKELEKKVSWAKEDAEKYKTKLYWAELKLKEDEVQYNALKEILENTHDELEQERE